MTSKGAKETIVTKLGFKSSSSAAKAAEAELERVRKENAHLRRKMDELAKRHVRPPDSDKSKLLERILALETLRERNNKQILLKDQEMETMRQQLSAKGGEVVASLQAQLEQRTKEAERRDTLIQTLYEETGNLKNQLAATSARCEVLDKQGTQNGQAPPADLVVVQDQLRDALEKNQQWLVYDQQREAYVQTVLTRTRDLEQQLNQHPSSDAPAKSGGQEQSAGQHQEYYDRLLLEAKRDLETQSQQAAQAQQELQAQRKAAARAQEELQSQREEASKLLEDLVSAQRSCEDRSRELSSFQRRYEETSRELSSFQGRYEEKSRELSSFQRRYEEKSRELEENKELLQTERFGNRHVVSEERKVSSDREERMRQELESMDARLEEERKRSDELLLQVNQLQTSLLSQSEDLRRMAALEQQIQLSAKDIENEKIDRRTVQHQLHKALKELRKAHDQITKLETAKQPSSRYSEPSSYNNTSRVGNLLDESFLECPQCHASYPTSQHRELLNHMDHCCM